MEFVRIESLSQDSSENLNTSVADVFREEYEKLKQQYSLAKSERDTLRNQLSLLTEDQTTLRSLNMDQQQIQASLKLNIEEKDATIASLKGQFAAMQKSLGDDVTNWRAKSLELMETLSNQESRHQEMRVTGQAALKKQELETARLQTQFKDLQKQVDDQEKKNQQAFAEHDQQKNELQSQLAKQQAATAAANETIKALEHNLRALSAKDSDNLKIRHHLTAEVRSLQTKNAALANKIAKMLAIRTRYKSVVRAIYQQQKTENVELKGRLRDHHSEIQKIRASYDTALCSSQILIGQLNNQIEALQTTFAAEKNRFEENFNTHFQKLKNSYVEKVKQLKQDHAQQVTALQFENQQEISRLQESRIHFQRLTETLSQKVNEERFNCSQLQQQLSQLKQQLQRTVSQRQALEHEVQTLRNGNTVIHKDLEKITSESARRYAEVQSQAIQAAEEVRVLKLQISEKSQMLVRLESDLYQAQGLT